MNSELEKNRMKVEKAFDNLRMPMDESELAEHTLGDDTASFIPTAALSSGLYDSSSRTHLGDIASGGPDTAAGDLSPAPDVDDIEEVMTARENEVFLTTNQGKDGGMQKSEKNGRKPPSVQSPNNPPLGVTTADAEGPSGERDPEGNLHRRNYSDDERKDWFEVRENGDAAPLSNLTSPSESKNDNMSPSPRHGFGPDAAAIHMGGGKRQQPKVSLRVPHPIDTRTQSHTVSQSFASGEPLIAPTKGE